MASRSKGVQSVRVIQHIDYGERAPVKGRYGWHRRAWRQHVSCIYHHYLESGLTQSLSSLIIYLHILSAIIKTIVVKTDQVPNCKRLILFRLEKEERNEGSTDRLVA
eukprot:scaffold115444_cov22-Prasinocladus_malaysianus.AAC.1